MAYGIERGVRFEILRREDLDRIHAGTLRILETVGIQVASEACRRLLRDHGSEVDERSRIARIPPHLVKEALAKTKASVTLAARNPKFDVNLDRKHSYMTANGNGAVTVDFETGARRASTKEDVAKSSRIIDYLPNVHVHWPMVSSMDQPPSTVHLHDLDASLNNTEKHVMYETGVTLADAKLLTEMGYLAAGGEEAFRRRPITSCLQCTFAPLQLDAGVMDASLYFADHGVPLVFFGMPQPGATGPATLVGSLIVGNAEVLAALTITQLHAPGSAVIYGMGNAPLDMRTATRSGGSPEHALSSAMATELAHWYGLPSCVGVSATAKSPGDQAVLEYYTGCVGPLLAGADLMCGIGLLEDSATLYFEQIVIDDEIVGAIARLLRGEWADEETMALDVIERVGPGKNFLAQSHTLRHFKTEHFMPNLIDRRAFDAWSADGSKTLVDKAREKTKWILANHLVPPLESDIQRKMSAVIEHARKTG
ncbi:MAG TPA: trimethylamine methyltransferase family protein [Thermoplasmata archaeon]|jgi:trimethylamine--corrinoid protein Co-methyltransferase